MSPDEERAHCAARCAEFNRAPYYATLGLVAESDAIGTSRVRMPFEQKLCSLYGAIHGGALLSLADATVNIAVVTTLEPDQAVTTVDMSMQFLEPAGQNDVVAEGRVTRRGKRLAFVECVLTAGGRTIARAHGVSHIGARQKIQSPKA